MSDDLGGLEQDITRDVASEIGMLRIQVIRLAAELKAVRARLDETEIDLAKAEAELVRVGASAK